MCSGESETMKQQDDKIPSPFNLRMAYICAVVFGGLTIAVVWLAGPSGNSTVHLIAQGLSYSGNDIYLLASNLLIIAWAWRKRLHSIIKPVLWMNFFVLTSVQFVKLIPFGGWALRPGGYPGGFPSGHATHAFVMAYALTACFPRFWWLWNLLAAGISWSRVEVGDHTPLQVTVGVCYGILIAWAFTSRWLKLKASGR